MFSACYPPVGELCPLTHLDARHGSARAVRSFFKNDSLFRSPTAPRDTGYNACLWVEPGGVLGALPPLGELFPLIRLDARRRNATFCPLVLSRTTARPALLALCVLEINTFCCTNDVLTASHCSAWKLFAARARVRVVWLTPSPTLGTLLA